MLCKTSTTLWSKFLQEISHLSPLFQEQKYLSARNRPRFILKKNDFWTPKNYFENEHPHVFSIGSSTAASPSPRRIPGALGFHLRHHPHIWIYIGAEQCGRIYRFTFFSFKQNVVPEKIFSLSQLLSLHCVPATFEHANPPCSNTCACKCKAANLHLSKTCVCYCSSSEWYYTSYPTPNHPTSPHAAAKMCEKCKCVKCKGK